MSGSASELARRLAREAEAVCRRYLSNGRREGRYWLVGDARNTPGRSLFVRLGGADSGKGAAGRWTDAASGEYGDLLDIIRESSAFPFGALARAAHERRSALRQTERSSPGYPESRAYYIGVRSLASKKRSRKCPA